MDTLISAVRLSTQTMRELTRQFAAKRRLYEGWDTGRMRRLLVVLVVLSLLPWSAAGTAETVTLTVSVENQSGDAVAGATLNASWDGGSTERTTAGNGKAFVDVPAGTEVTVSVDHPDYVRNRPVTVTAGENRDLSVPVHWKSSLAVTVEDGEGAVSDARVTAVKDGVVAADGSTSANGSFATGAVEAGSYEVRVAKRGYYRKNVTVDVENETARTVSVEQGSVELAVNVTDDHYGSVRPVAGVTVQVGSVGTVTTLDDGGTSTSVPVNSELAIAASKDGYLNASTELSVGESALAVNLTTNRVPRLDLVATNERVVAGERVVLSVTDAYGDPVANASVRLDGEVVGETDADGRYAPEIPDAGNHTLRAENGSLASDEVSVRAIAENPATSSAASTATSTATPTTTATRAGGDLRALTLVVAGVAALLVAVAGVYWWRGQ